MFILIPLLTKVQTHTLVFSSPFCQKPLYTSYIKFYIFERAFSQVLHYCQQVWCFYLFEFMLIVHLLFSDREQSYKAFPLALPLIMYSFFVFFKASTDYQLQQSAQLRSNVAATGLHNHFLCIITQDAYRINILFFNGKLCIMFL